jgi:sulfur carrier protein ThiS
MKITLKLVGGFIHTVGFSQKELDVEPGTTVADLLTLIAIDRRMPMVIARNGVGARVDEEVQPGDRVMVAPVFSGG